MPDRCRNLKSIKLETKLHQARRDRHNQSNKMVRSPNARLFYTLAIVFRQVFDSIL
jgi:hypothetical protein